MRRTTTALATLGLTGALLLAGCTDQPEETAPAVGDVLEVTVAEATAGNGTAGNELTLWAPDRRVWIPQVEVVDELTIDGDTVAAPDGASILTLARVWATASVLEVDEVSTLTLVAEGERIDLDLGEEDALAVVVPGDGRGAMIEIGFDGRVVQHELLTGALVPGSPQPYRETAHQLRVDDWEMTQTGFPAGVAVGDLEPTSPLPATVSLTSTSYLPELGWADDGRVWVTVDAGHGRFVRFGGDGQTHTGSGEASLLLQEVVVTSGGESGPVALELVDDVDDEPLGWAGVADVPLVSGDLVVDVVVRYTASGSVNGDGTPGAMGGDGTPGSALFEGQVEMVGGVVLEWEQ